jgi:hypothetical protein
LFFAEDECDGKTTTTADPLRGWQSKKSKDAG